jgi:NAD(P)-dependent dehydrogenase (short-subunit alcohol dehydrogenase family)
MSVRGKVAWITASAEGIGKATAIKLAEEGAKIVICDINETQMQKTKSQLELIGVEVLAVPYDAGKTEDIDNVFKEAINRFKTIDILVNNAGVTGPTTPIFETEVADWDKTLEINLRGMFYCIKLVAPYMIKQGGGKIVNLSSRSGKSPLRNRAAYCASKMGVIGLTRVAADELGKYNITVNAICPGLVTGDRQELLYKYRAEEAGITIEELRIRDLERLPLRRFIPPEEIAKMVLFLSDDETSNCITGQDYNVNSGSIMF